MSENFDLLGDPIPEGHGRRGRPPHLVTQENRNKVMMLLAFGWTNERIARALGITGPTLRKNYFRELKVRDEARDRMDAALANRLLLDALGGNVGAAREFSKVRDRNDLMEKHLVARGRPAEQAKAPKLGKKEQQLQRAHNPGGTPMGDLMAQRLKATGSLN